MAMSKKAEHHGENKNDCAGDVWSAPLVTGLAADDVNDQRKRGHRENHAAGVHANAADPFFEIVPVCLEYKPFVSEECERDAQEIREQTGYDITVRKHLC